MTDNTPCQSCLYARRTAAEVLRKEGWSACFLPLLFQAGEAYTPLVDPICREENLDNLSCCFVEKMDVKQAAIGWANNLRPDNTAKAMISCNGILLVKGVKRCPFQALE